MPVVAPYFFASAVSDFLEKSDDAILGTLAASNPFELSPEQRDAWLGEIALLRTLLPPYRGRGSVFFEFSIPRMGRRVDVALILDGVVFVLEFKVGAREFSAADIEQVWDYALDLKNFHRASHALTIIPILVATEAKTVPAAIRFPFADDRVFEPVNASPETLAGTLRDALALAERRENFDANAWATSAYSPTPTIIEAASALYSNHSVEAISRSDAAAKNLSETCAEISKIIAACKANGEKAICFVTGVPGAGKTLVGLNIATQESTNGQPAVYLSGNGPLVAVLTEALARDKVRRERARYDAARRAGTSFQTQRTRKNREGKGSFSWRRRHSCRRSRAARVPAIAHLQRAACFRIFRRVETLRWTILPRWGFFFGGGRRREHAGCT